MATTVTPVFESAILLLPLSSIVPVKEISPAVRYTRKYQQILASLKHLGLIEPFIVYPTKGEKYWLLDGNLRLDALRQMDVTEARCIVATDDESYTYNKKVNYLPPIAENYMILKAIKNGVSEERIAAALSVDVACIRRKRNLLNGICEEAAILLKDKRIGMEAFNFFRRMKPLRQIAAAEIMIASNNFSQRFAKSLWIVTKPEFLVDGPAVRRGRPGLNQQKSLVEQETFELVSDYKRTEETYGREVLGLTVYCRYLERLLTNERIEKYLSKHHQEVLNELRQVVVDVKNDKERGILTEARERRRRTSGLRPLAPVA
jgi:hypothetical protein